ncbi:MAG: DEAD/DEAH box helicase [Vicinamibacterales bacterium]
MPDARTDQPAPGDLIWVRRRLWRVKSTHAGDGLTRVLVEGWPSGQSRTFLLPCDRWSREVARHSRFVSPNRALAWLASCAARAHPAHTPGCIITSNVELLAYQLEPGLEMLAGRRRILIADDVGLGKTIQAALIVAQTLSRSGDARVLVLAPASLLAQWSDELQTRFNLAAHTADADHFTRLRSERRYLSNPWQSPGVWLASPDYLKQPHVIDGMPRAPFDLVVIDEAHMMAGNSQRHSAVHSIAQAAGQVVLLTATPHDGDESRFQRLLSLGATRSPADSLTIFRRTRTSSARHVRRLTMNPGAGVSQILAAIDAFARAGRSNAPNDGLLLICAVFRKRALSSLAALAASLSRRLALVDATSPETADQWTQPGLGFGETVASGQDEGDVMSADEWSVLRGLTGLSLQRERGWLQRLIGVVARATSASRGEPKLAGLTSLLQRSKEPVVVFTEYRDSLLAIAAAVTRSRRVALLHGGLTGSEQRRALNSFLDGRADALLATDVASQGLNLQHRARWVVHFDLPWTPMRLEQRVGRVDRIGQTRVVHVTMLGLRHQSEDALRVRVAVRREASDAAPLPNCTRWTSAANSLARLFRRQRALDSCWRGPDPIALLRASFTVSTLRRLGADTEGELRTLVEIPLVSSTGEVVERHFGWLARLDPSEAGDGLCAALVRRARALGARAQRRRARLHAAQASGNPAPPMQRGLFEAGDLTATRSDGVEGPAAAPTAEPDVTVHVGQPRDLLVVERRR